MMLNLPGRLQGSLTGLIQITTTTSPNCLARPADTRLRCNGISRNWTAAKYRATASAAASSSGRSPLPPPEERFPDDASTPLAPPADELGKLMDSFVKFARNPLPYIAQTLRFVRSAVDLVPQFCTPPLPSVVPQTLVALAVVAGFVAVVCGVDSACALLTRCYVKPA